MIHFLKSVYSDGLGMQCLFPTARPFLQPGTGVRVGLGVGVGLGLGLSSLVAPAASGSVEPATGFSKPSEVFVDPGLRQQNQVIRQ